MIRSFKNSDTEKVWNREHVPAMGSDLQRAAQKKLRLLNAATELNSLRVPPGDAWRSWSATEPASVRSASTTNTGSASLD